MIVALLPVESLLSLSEDALSEDAENTYICKIFRHEQAMQGNEHFSMDKKPV